jgi:hypothetical protein
MISQTQYKRVKCGVSICNRNTLGSCIYCSEHLIKRGVEIKFKIRK